MLFLSFAAAILGFVSVEALEPYEAAPTTNLKTSTVTPLSSSELAAFAPFTQFARAAYCPASKLQNWNCGEACNANSDFHVTLTGGDGNAVQTYFVGFSPSLKTIIVAHEGTDPTKFLADVTDFDFSLVGLNSTLFPGVSSSVKVHDGFQKEQALTAKPILKAVKKIMKNRNTKNIAVVGHSLGGALAELDSLFLTLNLPKAKVRAVTYGTPRVGNPAFVQLIDTKVPDFVRIDNKLDPVPTLPGKFLGFAQPHGEIHILSPGNAVSCPGDDDSTDAQCTVSSVPNIFASHVADHTGPYEGIYIGVQHCT